MAPGLKKTLLAGIVVLAGAQLIRPAQTNPSTDASQTLQAAMPAGDPAVAAIGRACADCHSNETIWPWYSKVAPVSWLVAHDVNDARRHVNFSKWSTYSPAQQQKHLKESCDEVTRGDMPMWYYTIIHTDSKLSPADVGTICALAAPAR